VTGDLAYGRQVPPLPRLPRRTVLREDSAPGYHRTEWATLSPLGALTIEGQSLTSGSGADEYEWAFSVPADQVPGLVAALGGATGDDVLPLLVEHCRVHHPPDFGGLMDAAGVQHTFWSRLGD
jgi:hypothetical protein